MTLKILTVIQQVSYLAGQLDSYADILSSSKIQYNLCFSLFACTVVFTEPAFWPVESISCNVCMSLCVSLSVFATPRWCWQHRVLELSF